MIPTIDGDSVHGLCTRITIELPTTPPVAALCQHTPLFETHETHTRAYNPAQSHTNGCDTNMQCERTSLAPFRGHIPTPPHLGRAPSRGFKEGSERVSRMFDSPWAISMWPVATTDRPATPSPPRTRQLKSRPTHLKSMRTNSGLAKECSNEKNSAAVQSSARPVRTSQSKSHVKSLPPS